MTATTATPAHTTETRAPDGHIYEVMQMGFSFFYETLPAAIQAYQEAAAEATPYVDHPCLYVDGLRIHSSNLLWGPEDDEPRPLHVAEKLVREQMARGY